MAVKQTRHRYARGGGLPVSTTPGPGTLLSQLGDELNQVKLEEAFNAAANNDPEGFIKVASDLIAHNSPDSERLKQLSLVAKNRIDEQNWATDLKSGAATYEDFQNYLNQRLSDAQPGSIDASSILANIANVNQAIKARDEAKLDQQAMLDFVNTDDNVKYAAYLRDKLTRTTDAALQQTIVTHINELSTRQDKKEAVARAVARNKAVNGFTAGGAPLDQTIQALSSLRDSSSSSAEADSVQKDINSLFQLDIAKKRNDIISQFSSGSMGAADAISRLQTLANGPADESSVNTITSAIDHIRSVNSSNVSSAAAAGTANAAGNATKEFNDITNIIQDHIRHNETPTEPELRRLAEAGKQLSAAETAVGDAYQARGNATTADTWYNKSAKRDDDVQKTLTAVDDAAFKRAGVTSTDEVAFKTGLQKMTDPEQQVNAVLGELRRIRGVTGITSAGNQRVADAYQKVVAAGQEAVNASGKFNKADQDKVDQAFADYQARGGKLTQCVFSAYLNDYNRGPNNGGIDMETLNKRLGINQQDTPGLLGTTKTDTTHAPYTQTDQTALTAALSALNAGGLRQQSSGDKLAAEAWNVSPESLSQQQRNDYLETLRETTRGQRQLTIQPLPQTLQNTGFTNDVMQPGVDPTAQNGVGDPIQQPQPSDPLVVAHDMGFDQNDPWGSAYSMFADTKTNIDLPQFNVPDLPPASPIIWSNENSGMSAVDAHDFGISDTATGDSGVTAPPPPSYGGGGGGRNL